MATGESTLYFRAGRRVAPQNRGSSLLHEYPTFFFLFMILVLDPRIPWPPALVKRLGSVLLSGGASYSLASFSPNLANPVTYKPKSSLLALNS